MATSLYRIRTTTAATAPGRELLDVLESLGDNFARLKRIFAAMTQEKDGNAGDATDFVTPATTFGYVDGSNAITSSVAKASYDEINSFIGNGGPSLEQCCARHKQ